MKKIIILLALIALSCQDKSNGSLRPIVNAHYGDYTMEFNGDLIGASTIGVQANGVISNGIICELKPFLLKNIRFDILGNATDNNFKANVFFPFKLNNIKMFGDANIDLGTIEGQFINDTVSGSYYLTIDTLIFQGNFNMHK